jgi:glyoxylase-like metal-dependent hydrolase (beta-lactamase superfamily II)
MDEIETREHGHSQSKDFFRFKVGDYQALSVSDGVFADRAVRYLVAPEATDEEYDLSFDGHGISDERDQLHANALLIDTGHARVLFDTGAGPTMGPGCGHLKSNLVRAGIEPQTIDIVVISHGHMDHLGGISDAEGNPNFPNARFFISTVEWNFWTSDTVENHQMLPDEMKAAGMIVARQQLASIRDKVTLIEPGDFILPSIQAIDAKGHSPGQLAFRAHSADSSITYTADTMHMPSISLQHPDWVNGLDNDREAARATRKAFIDRFTAENALIIVPHFPFPGVGQIAKSASAHYWRPLV